MMFQKATKTQARLRFALLGPAGSGKTYSALRIARALVGADGRVALMDTEHGSASKYADLFSFDQVAPERFDVETYLGVIAAAGTGGYDLLILDSLSHAWAGKGGLLEFVDARAKASQSGNSFSAWRDATPKHNELIEAMLACPCHLIVTMRTKMEYVQDRDEKGRTTIRKVGLQPVQRDGLEYEFDVVGDLTADNDLIITKTRCPVLRGRTFGEPGEDVAAILRPWLGAGAPAPTAGAPVAQIIREAGAASPAVIREFEVAASAALVPGVPTLAQRKKFSEGTEAEKRERLLARWSELWSEYVNLELVDTLELEALPTTASLADWTAAGGMLAQIVGIARKRGNPAEMADIARSLRSLAAKCQAEARDGVAQPA